MRIIRVNSSKGKVKAKSQFNNAELFSELKIQERGVSTTRVAIPGTENTLLYQGKQSLVILAQLQWVNRRAACVAAVEEWMEIEEYGSNSRAWALKQGRETE